MMRGFTIPWLSQGNDEWGSIVVGTWLSASLICPEHEERSACEQRSHVKVHKTGESNQVLPNNSSSTTHTFEEKCSGYPLCTETIPGECTVCSRFHLCVSSVTSLWFYIRIIPANTLADGLVPKVCIFGNCFQTVTVMLANQQIAR